LHHWCEGKTQLDANFFKAGDLGWMDWREVAPKIACPTLLITATPDKGGIITSEMAQMAAEMNEQISVAHISGTGHHVRFENYPAYRDAVKTFLAQI
jgi:pimeloyl-ACP methyl ester carboxylesterase